MESSPPLPFVLTLHALLPLRSRRHRRTLDLGYQLRLVDGPALADDDVVLDAFGAFVVPLVGDDHDAEALQHDAFAPGRRLTLLPEGVDGDGDAVVGVWDADGIRRAGVVPWEKAAVVAAAAQVGLTVEALVLREERAVLDDRRVVLTLLVHAPAIVRVDVPADDELHVRPRPSVRNRVVLVADGSGELRFWDPAGRGGPIAVDELPLSSELVAEFRRLSAAFDRVAGQADDVPADPLEGVEREWVRLSLEARTQALWERARTELGRSYAIGLLASGMSRPSGTPTKGTRTTTRTTSRRPVCQRRFFWTRRHSGVPKNTARWLRGTRCSRSR
jgi:hypothetical protein